jgi:putative membrane protein
MKHKPDEPQKTAPDAQGDSTERTLLNTTKATTSYVFRAPNPVKLGAFVIIFSLFVGFFINFDVQNLSRNFTSNNFYNNVIIFGLVFIGFPALLSGLISTPLAELLGGVFYYRRSALLAFISTVIIAGVLIIGKFLKLIFEFDLIIILIFGYALIFSLRHSVLLATSNHKHLSSLPASINQSILGYIFLCLIPNTFFNCNYQMFFFMLGFTLIFMATAVLWLYIVNSPFRRNFNINGLFLMRHALSQFTDQKSSGQVLEKEFFSKIGTNANVRVGTVSIRRKQKSSAETNRSQNSKQDSKLENEDKLKTLIVIPSLHPGPFGLLGGSNLPGKLFNYLKGLTSSLMVFHGPATHDYNPVATSECKKVAKSIRKLVKKTEFSDNTSSFLRETKSTEEGSKKSRNSHSKSSNLNLCSQKFGNGNLYIHTSSPESTDDIDYPVGEAIIQKAKSETKRDSLFIDAHNCLKPGTGQVNFGSEKANNMIDLVSKLNRKLEDDEDWTIKCGFASDNRFKISQGIGPMGIQVLVVRCESQNNEIKEEVSQEYRSMTNAYILLDGNNIIPGLREQILISVKNLVDDAEVFTTDNHIVNATMGGYNPVGLKLEPKKVVKIIRQLVKSAHLDCEPVEVGVNSTIVKNVGILGQDTPLRISTTINATMSVMRSSLVSTLAVAVAACWALTLL